jgi:hypothetical protein
MNKLVKLLVVMAVSVSGVLTLNTINAKAFSITGIKLTRTTNQINGGHDIFDNVAITNTSRHRARMVYVVVKEKGKKAIKQNYFIQPGGTVPVYTTNKDEVNSIYRRKFPRKFTVTVYRMSNKQTMHALKHKHTWKGMRWTKHKMTGGIE